MKKEELVSAVSKRTGVTQVAALKVIEAALDVTTEEIGRGGEVSIRGFGILKTNNMNPRKSRNPKTKQVYEIPARRVIKFKAGINLRNVL